MGQLYPVSSLPDRQQLARDIPVKRRQPRHQFAAVPEIEAVKQVEDDAGSLLQAAAATRVLALELTLRPSKLAQEQLVLFGNVDRDRCHGHPVTEMVLGRGDSVAAAY